MIIWGHSNRMHEVAENDSHIHTYLEGNCEVEDVDDARLLLGLVVKYCPSFFELWLALVRLKNYGNV